SAYFRRIVSVDANAMPDVTAREMRNAFALNRGDDFPEEIRDFRAWLDDVVTAKHALFNGGVVFLDFVARISQRRAARHVGTGVTVGTGGVKADKIALLQLPV